MAGYCLIPQLAVKFKAALESGKIDITKLSDLSSAERQQVFAEVVGADEAKSVNALFESKLLLKNQQQGMLSWAKTVTGIKEPVKRDIFSAIQRLDKALSPAEEKDFLNALVNKRLGVEVTLDEAKAIHGLSQQIEAAKAGLNEDKVTFKSEDARFKYGAAKTALNEYMKDLKSQAMNLTKEDFKMNPLRATGEAISQAAGTAKSATSSMDNSALFRQGWKTLWTNPYTWSKNAQKTWGDLWRSLGGEKTLEAVYADGFSRENNLNGYYKKAKLAVGVTEEAYPSSIPEKIPYYNKLYNASQNAYAGFLYRQRMDIFDKYIEIAKNTGVELSDKELSSIGQMVNSLTGRGSFGKYEGEAVNAVNNILFSPRLIKSHLDVLGGHILSGGEGSNFVRKEAARNLLKIVAGSASVLLIAKAINPASVSFDPRSSDFGKIKVGDTRFDVSGGMGSILTLASRLLPSKNKGKWGFFSKSSTSGKVSELNSGKFGAQTLGDVVQSFLENKLSPAAALIDHIWIKGTDFKGKKPTVAGEAESLLVPISYQNITQTAKDPKAANVVLSTIADALGISTNTYSKDDFKKGK